MNIPEKKKPKQKETVIKSTVFSKIFLLVVVTAVFPLALSYLLLITTYNEAVSSILTEDQLKELSQNIRTQIVLILILTGMLFVFGSFVISRRITYPLKQLVEGTRKVAAGKLKFRFRIKSGDELEVLAKSFNTMIERIEDQREREELIGRMKSEFISIAAHQLRTPLSAVKWILRMFLDGDLGAISEKQREFLEKSFQSNERMIRLINDLLDVSRIEEGRFGFTFAKHDFKEFLKKFVDPFLLEAKERNIDLKIEVPKESIKAVFDPDRLRMAFSNILENALTYTLPGGTVNVSIKKEKQFLKITIEDTGIGILEEQQSRIFTKFFRGDNAVRFQTEGSGLGLYLAKNIIQRHGGDVWFESKEGKNTVFYFTIPFEEKMIPKEEVFEEFITSL